MPRPAASKGLNLRWLEVFQLCARTGSLREAAREAGLSVSTVSHQLARSNASCDRELNAIHLI